MRKQNQQKSCEHIEHRSTTTNEQTTEFLGNYKGIEAHIKIHEYIFGLIVNTHFWETLGQKNV